MNKLVEWFARNGVAANLLAAVLIIGGVMNIFTLKQEVFPEFSSDMITISVPYRGAAPEEVEEGVCVKIEEAIRGLEGIKEVVSNASEGVGLVRAEVQPGADAAKLLDEIKSKVDAIETFPDETEEPVIEEVILKKQVLSIAVSGDVGETTLKRVAENLRDDLLLLPGITQVELANVRPYEVSVEVSEDALRKYVMTIDEVSMAIRRSSMDLPGGAIRSDGGEILLRAKGQAYRGVDFEKIVVRQLPGGAKILLGDVATVIDGFAETDQSSHFNGEPSSLVKVFRVGNQNAIDISNTVIEFVDNRQALMPAGVHIETWQDDSIYLRARISTLVRNGAQGLILVFFVLAIFLRFGLALWVSIGIPISFLGTFALMPQMNTSINVMSLFAFIVVLGIVVDDAIVVGENIHKHQHAGMTGLQGAVHGAQEMMVPVFFAVMTSVAAFYSLSGISGNTGQVLRVIPLVVMPTLIFSLVESLLILPAHLSHGHANKEPRIAIGRAWRRFQGLFTSGLAWFIEMVYRPFLRRALRRRYLTMSVGFATFILTIGLISGGWIKFRFLPSVDGDYVAAMLTMPLGTPEDETRKVTSEIEAAVKRVKERVEKQEGKRVVKHVLSSIGSQPYKAEQENQPSNVGLSGSGAHLGEITIELMPSEERTFQSAEIAKLWREEVGRVPGVEELIFTASIFSAGNTFDIQLEGKDIVSLQSAASELKDILAGYPGVIDISDSFRGGKDEVKLSLKPEAESLGIRLEDVARQVRQAFYGEEAQRIQRGRDDVRVMVRFPEEARQSLGDLESMRIRTADGREIPFSEVAEADFGKGFASIRRVNQLRTINVKADVDESAAAPDAILEEIEKKFLNRLDELHPGVTYSYAGEKQQQNETMMGLMIGFVMALIGIYALLAIPFKSYLQPAIVMTAIPFGFVGAVWGHVITGRDVTILSMFGLVALTGVVVNDSLVMVDYVNRKRRDGLSLMKAVNTAGADRFRAILLTSMTTFAGLTPLLLEKSVEAQFLIPMAISLAFGVIFATGITLILVPSTYLILEDIKWFFRELFGLEHVDYAEREKRIQAELAGDHETIERQPPPIRE